MTTTKGKNYIYLKLIGFGILFWLLYRLDLSEVLSILSGGSSPELLFWALCLMLANSAVKFMRYQYILRQQGVKLSFFKTSYYSLAAIYLSFVTPGRVGEASKAYFIHKATGTPMSRLLAGAVLDRVFDVYTLLLIVLAGLLILSPFGSNNLFVMLSITPLLLLPLVFLSKGFRDFFIRAISGLQEKFRQKSSWSEHISDFFSEIDLLLNWRMLIGFGASLIAYTLFFMSCLTLSRSLMISLSYIKVSVFVASANILSFLPISFAGLGTREATLVYLFSTVNLTGEAALAFSALVFTFTYMLFGIMGFVCLLTIRDRKDQA